MLGCEPFKSIELLPFDDDLDWLCDACTRLRPVLTSSDSFLLGLPAGTNLERSALLEAVKDD